MTTAKVEDRDPASTPDREVLAAALTLIASLETRVETLTARLEALEGRRVWEVDRVVAREVEVRRPGSKASVNLLGSMDGASILVATSDSDAEAAHVSIAAVEDAHAEALVAIRSGDRDRVVLEAKPFLGSVTVTDGDAKVEVSIDEDTGGIMGSAAEGTEGFDLGVRRPGKMPGWPLGYLTTYGPDEKPNYHTDPR